MVTKIHKITQNLDLGPLPLACHGQLWMKTLRLTKEAASLISPTSGDIADFVAAASQDQHGHAKGPHVAQALCMTLQQKAVSF